MSSCKPSVPPMIKTILELVIKVDSIFLANCSDENCSPSISKVIT